MQRTPCAVALLCKAPIPGFAKTRLIPHLGEMDTVHFQEEMILQAVMTALEASVGPVELYCEPDESHPFFGKIMKKYPVRLSAQPPGDLGARLHTSASAALLTADSVLMVGTDCPVMPAYYLQEAAADLARDCDAVLGPSEDGGYVLLGLRQAHEGLFDGLPWGTPLVLNETQSRMRQLGWRYQSLAALWDVQTPAGYQRWRLITEAMSDPPQAQRL
ncbi:MAG: TIGR04282 family arsenosugar biosynthesis glycosyltransferase [Gammaproteobacteria bacterium]|nr:TIGR04282 family arsenosugar biosynthesis glycosyltransferase [Gammaproteobacteria bacterium]MDE2346689.1 TIGR04282 family arsenosugar biosynthesis glycosyltransferase [Gammaproteobacteria bacterium]